MNCPCLGGLPYDECCGPFHRGESVAPTAERLMRSRYSAYSRGLPRYLLSTWHRTGGGMLDTQGTVEFRASYRVDTQPGSQHETSSFVKENGAWFYVDGE